MTIRQERHYDSDLMGSTMLRMRNALVPLFTYASATGVSNGTDQTEDTAKSFSIPANTFSAQYPAGGDIRQGGIQGLIINAWGNFATSGDTKTIRLYFGSEVISTGGVTTSNKNWWMSLEVLRTATSRFNVWGSAQYDTTMVTPYASLGATEDETAAIVAKVTIQNGSNNVVAGTLTGFLIQAIEQ
jgi:hypothetical protein